MKKIIGLTLLVFILFSCKKNELGGNSVIQGVVMHHAKVITSASVFIKFNATDQPSDDTTAYDAKVRVDKNGNFKFNVYKGNYFLYGYGYDYTIAAPYIVVGGLAVKIKSKQTITNTLYISEQ